MLKQFGILNSIIAVIGVLAFGYLIYQIWYGVTATPASAVVESYEKKRRFQGSAVVGYEAEGKPVEGELQLWLLELEKGEQVAILYRPDKPELVQLDNFWQRYAASIGVVLFAAAVVGWELLKGFRHGSAGQSATGKEAG
jgi:hypothetical protein